MPSWGILKSSKKEKRSARKVHFVDGQQEKHQEKGEEEVMTRDRLSSLESDASGDQQLRQDCLLGLCPNLRHLDLSHDDVEDEEEKQCLRHLDHLGMSLENTFKEVDTIDACVKKLRYNFDHETVAEKRFMSCMCSAKLARAACCKKQIRVWHQLQHDMQEMCCHHHAPVHIPGNCPGPHQGSDVSLTEHCSDHASSDCDSAASLSLSTSSSHDTMDSDFAVSRLARMVLFDVVRQRLDPSVDSKTFVEHWVLNVHHDDRR